MLYLPILSDLQKENLKFEFRKRLIILYIVDIFVVSIIFVFLLLSLRFIVLAKISLIKKTSELEMAAKVELEIKDKEAIIKDFNKSLLAFNVINADHFDVSEVLYNFSLLIPSSAQLYSLQLNKEAKTLKAQGKVPWREDVLILQNNLEQSVFFSNIDFPLSNFTQKENVDFYLSASVDDGGK